MMLEQNLIQQRIDPIRLRENTVTVYAKPEIVTRPHRRAAVNLIFIISEHYFRRLSRRYKWP